MKGRRISTGLNLVALLVTLYFYVSYCSPISYKENSGTTPKKYADKCIFKKEYYTIPPNVTKHPHWVSGGIASKKHKAQQGHPKSFNKIKSVIPGEMTMRRMNDEDDDDDDDGGEYGGLVPSASDVKRDHPKPDLSKLGQGISMVAVREVDVVAVKIPRDDADASGQECQEWSEWSPCSTPCGRGVQSRWRSRPAGQEKEQQYRTCHLADCM